MNSPVHQQSSGLTVKSCRLLAIGWFLIAVKCGLVVWAINHWNVPIKPMWVIGPTLLFAGLVTALWTTHRE